MKLDIYDLMGEEAEPINVSIGRLRGAIMYHKSEDRLLELLDRISKKIIAYGVKHPEDIL